MQRELLSDHPAHRDSEQRRAPSLLHRDLNLVQRILRDSGFPATIRQRRGIDVAAGCGQLRALE